MTLVADTSALVSLGCAAAEHGSIVELFFDGYDVYLPPAVIDELESTAEYDDQHGRSARRILERAEYTVQAGSADAELPLDSGETATVGLANELEAGFCYCDEFVRLSVIHAALVTARLITTPRVLEAFVLRGDLRQTEALDVLDAIIGARSWEGNAYVQQARTWIDGDATP